MRDGAHLAIYDNPLLCRCSSFPPRFCAPDNLLCVLQQTLSTSNPPVPKEKNILQMVSIRTLCVAAVLLAVSAQAQVCSRSRSCSSCIADPEGSCGWDASVGSCVAYSLRYTVNSSNWYYDRCPGNDWWSFTGWALWLCGFVSAVGSSCVVEC
jgi:hypothetical protein